MITGWYYLHENGDLIYKKDLDGTAADIRESDFAKGLWPMDVTDREMAWNILVEGLAGGALRERVIDLAEKWGCDDSDAEVYADRLNVILSIDGNVKCATRHDFINVQVDPSGFGDTNLEALANLCRDLGYVPQKMWGASFKDLTS